MAALYKKMSIAHKLMIAPLLVAVLLLGFGIFSYVNTHMFQEDVQTLLAGPVATEQLTQEAEATVNATHAAAYRSLALLNLKSEKAAEAAQEMLTQQLTAMSDLERDLEAHPSPELHALIEPLKVYEAAVADAYDSATSDTNLGAMMMQGVDKNYDALIESLRGASASSRLLSVKSQKEMDARIDNLQIVQCGVLLFAVAAGLSLAFLIGKKISHPLHAMQLRISEIEHRADFSLRIKVENEDEVGQTAISLNALLDALQSSIQEVNSVVGAVAQGNFEKRVNAPLKGDMAIMKEAVNESAERVMLTMNGFNQMMGALQKGDFSVRIALDNMQGEYKRAADQAISAMQALKNMLGDVGHVMQNVSQGNLSLRITAQGQGDLDALKSSINASLDALGSAMRTINQNARQVAAASSQSSQAIGQISDGALNQTHAIGQVATAVRQTVTSVADVSRNTEVASQKSRESVTIVRDGIKKMEHMIEVVNSIASNSEKINKITEVIEKIANKTNLLSLNAAIEAARAGEHGKGFAVVADEVGKLAVNSATSSQEIAQLVQQAVAEAHRAVSAVHEVSADMARIESGSQETDDMLRRIANALEEQSSAVEQINANLSSVDNIARSNASASEEITETVIELSRIADSTRQEVEKFTV